MSSMIIRAPRHGIKVATRFERFRPVAAVLPNAGVNLVDGKPISLANGAIRHGYGYDIPAGTAYVNVGSDALVSSTDYTYIFRSKLRSFSNQYTTPIGIKSSTGNNSVAFYSNNPTYSDIAFGDGTSVGEHFSLTQFGPVIGTWHTFVYINSGHFSYVFCNGSLLVSTGASLGFVSGNTVIGQLSDSSTTSPFDGTVDRLIVFNGPFPLGLGQDVSADPDQIFRTQVRKIFVPASGLTLTGATSAQANTTSTAGVTLEHNLTGATSAQANTSGTGAISQGQTLVGVNCSQVNTSSTGAVTQGHVLSGANCSQANTSATGTIAQTHVLTGAASAQANTSSSGSIAQGSTLVGAACSQANSGQTGAIGQTHILTGSASSQVNSSSTGAVAQSQVLTAAGSSQVNTSASVAVTLGVAITLVGATCTQANSASTAGIVQAHILICAPSIQDNIAAASAVVQEHILVGTDCNQTNSCLSGMIGDLTPTYSLNRLYQLIAEGRTYTVPAESRTIVKN